MKMLAITALAVASLCAGCAAFQTQSPGQVATTICTPLQTEVDLLKTSGVFTGGAQATLTQQVQPDIDNVCSASATVTKASLQNLVNAAIPVIIAAINVSSMDSQHKTEAILAIGAFSMTINTALSLQAAPMAMPVIAPMGASATLVAGR